MHLVITGTCLSPLTAPFVSFLYTSRSHRCFYFSWSRSLFHFYCFSSLPLSKVGLHLTTTWFHRVKEPRYFNKCNGYYRFTRCFFKNGHMAHASKWLSNDDKLCSVQQVTINTLYLWDSCMMTSFQSDEKWSFASQLRLNSFRSRGSTLNRWILIHKLWVEKTCRCGIISSKRILFFR